jgi:hypothetical protein
MSAHALYFKKKKKKKKNQNGITNELKKKGGGKEKEWEESQKGIRVEGIKGGKKGKRRGFFFWLRLRAMGEGEVRLTGLLVGVGNPQHIVSGSSALEAS